MLTIDLTTAQARALLEHGRFGKPPGHLNGRNRRALTNAVERLRAVVEGAEHRDDPLLSDLKRLSEALIAVRRTTFRDLVEGRLRDLLSTALLWTAAEELPTDVRQSVLDVNLLGEGGWAAEVLDLLDAHGIAVALPGDVTEEDNDGQ